MKFFIFLLLLPLALTASPRNELDGMDEFYGCVRDQKVGFYAHHNRLYGIPKQNVIDILIARNNTLPKSKRFPNPGKNMIILGAYLVEDVNSYQYSYQVFSNCMKKNELDEIRFLKPVIES